MLGGARLKQTVAQVDWSPSFLHLLHFNYLNVASLPSLMGHPPSYTHTVAIYIIITALMAMTQDVMMHLCHRFCESGLEGNSGERSLP